MEKLKIIIASETYPPDVNGAARFSGQLASSLANKGHQVVVIAPSLNIKDQVENNNNLKVFRMKSVKVKKVHPYFRNVVPLNLARKINKIIKDFKPDIIHIQNHFILGRACLKIAKRENIPIIGTNHFMPDNLLEYLPKLIVPKASDIMWKDFLKIYNQLDAVTSPSLAAKALVKKVGLKKDVIVISNGINLDNFKKLIIEDNDFSKFNLDKNIPIFIFVGRLEVDKNIDLILKAVKLMLKKEEVQIVIVGKGKDENQFKKLAKNLNIQNKVTFTGEVSESDLQKLLSIANAYIASGSAELQGIAAMEAMAMSLPVLALNAVALPELVNQGENGLLFELDENDLADKMLEIITDKNKLEEMGKRSRILIKKHSQPEIIKTFEKVYVDIISKQKNS